MRQSQKPNDNPDNDQETDQEKPPSVSTPDDNNHVTTASSSVRPENPFAKASLLSRLFFLWPYPLLKLGMERPLQEDDLATILPKDSSKYNRDYFWNLWHAEVKQAQLKQQQLQTTTHNKKTVCKPSLHRMILKDYFRSTWFVQPLMMVAQGARVVQAVVLGLLIQSFEGTNDNGYLWAGILVICGIIVLFEHHHVFYFTWRKGMQLRIACVAAIHDKSLRLSSTHQQTSASYGRIMNLASNDVERFILAALFINYLIWSPIQAIAILIVGCFLLGPAFAAGFALLVLVFVPLQFYLSGKFAYYRSKIAQITDQRVTFVSQAVRGARVMKMSGYEYRFLDRIANIRKQEIHQISKANTLKSWNEALFFATNVVISVVIFLVHVLAFGQKLEPGIVFTTFTLINILQLEMTKHVSLGVMGLSEVYVSISRIQKFLEFPELPVSSTTSLDDPALANDKTKDTNLPQALKDQEQSTTTDGSSNVCISMSKVKCYWNEVAPSDLSVVPLSSTSSSSHSTVDNNKGETQVVISDKESGNNDEHSSATSSQYLALEDITLDFERSQLTAIIGAVGSGKSALIQALVQELPVSSGRIGRKYNKLAYAAQDPWIMDGTVEENIVMGCEMNRDWYNEVVKACGLVLDFEQLRDGDQTLVGDRGVQCSGGQRARIGLARAIYRDADVLIVDDPLSAVDSKVGRQIFYEALLGLGVNRGKCVILATHQHQYVHECRCVLVMEGKVACDGSYESCVAASGGKLTAHEADDAAKSRKHKQGAGEDDSTTKETLEEDLDESIDDSVEDVLVDDKKKLDEDDDQKEQSLQGLVRLETYLNYMRAMGGLWVGFALLVLFCVTQASVLVTIAFVGKWAERPLVQQKEWNIVGPIIGLSVSVILFSVVRAFVSFQLTIAASRRLHDRMTKAVLRAKIEFFDTNPLGRIMNRFSADVGSNDDLLPTTIFDFSVIAFMVLGALITTVITLPFTLVVFPPLLWYFWSVRKIFVTSSRELKRLEGLARSPIFAMLSESLGGIATIRANDAVAFFQRKFQEAHDGHTRAFFAFISASRWVGFRMDSIMFFFLAFASFLAVLFQRQNWFQVDPAILGLSLSMLLQLAGIFQWCIRQSAEVVNQMVSVERVLQFGDLEPEAPLELEGDKALLEQNPPRWPPPQGAIEVQNMCVRYRASLPLALQDVSFSIPAGARVGIVGRTGSGKSTTVQALFRLLEAEQGQIVIDGVKIQDLGLHALRTHISVLPQVPTLFSGCTVRENLDLFSLHSDDEIAEVLTECHMLSVVNELVDGWDSIVSENGSNFSVGQRQLLCLARALLSRNKILVLDEATASVDRRTDQLLQQALLEQQTLGTILSVAHRLDTVIDNDYILVLGGGKVLEYGKPADLLRQSNGAFASMVNDTGESMAQELQRRAFAKEAQDKAEQTKDKHV